MTTNPFYNALFAIVYIVGLVSLAFYAPHLMGGQEQSIMYPMVALSVLVLSVALMAYLFFYQPVIMLLDGKRKEAASLFLQTIGIFAIGTVVILVITYFVTH